MSPATMPSPSAPIVTAASPVRTPARARSSGAPTSSPSAETAATRSSAARTARSASSSVAVGRSPDRHHRVADELLDRAAVERDQPAARVEVARQKLAHLLGVARLRERREADEVGEEHRDEPALRRQAPPARAGGCGLAERRAAFAAERVVRDRRPRRRPGSRARAARRSASRTCGLLCSRPSRLDSSRRPEFKGGRCGLPSRPRR